MPRRRRLVVPNLPHHVVQRGHNRRPVFDTDHDRMVYLATLEEFRAALGIKVHAWCLMTNHVHLVVDPGDDDANLGLLMKRLAGRHTRRLNRLQGATGTAWEGRFRSSPIDSERYLLACTRYVELNPVRAGLVANPADYRWSSYRAKAGLEPLGWLDLDPCFLALAPTLPRQQAIYRDWIEAAVLDAETQLIRTAVRRNQLTGADEFALEVERRTGTRVVSRGRGRPARPSRVKLEQAGFAESRIAVSAPARSEQGAPMGWSVLRGMPAAATSTRCTAQAPSGQRK
jgi:putative transposase